MIWLDKKLHVCVFTLLTSQTWHLVLGLVINKPNPKKEKKNYKQTCKTIWLNEKNKKSLDSFIGLVNKLDMSLKNKLISY